MGRDELLLPSTRLEEAEAGGWAGLCAASPEQSGQNPEPQPPSVPGRRLLVPCARSRVWTRSPWAPSSPR